MDFFECKYSGEIYFVEWSNDSKSFINKNLEIGSIEKSFNIEDCKKVKDSLFVEASIFFKNKFNSNKKDEFFYIIGIKNNRPIDTLYKFSKISSNNYAFSLKKYDSFIFKEKESFVGSKFLMKSFK